MEDIISNTVNNNHYLNLKRKSTLDKDNGSLLDLLKETEYNNLNQSQNIKLGIALEKVINDLIFNVGKYENINKYENIKVKNEKGKKEKDIIYLVNGNNIIYTEIKSNINLDTEKSKETINKVLSIKEDLQKQFPEKNIFAYLTNTRYLIKSDIPQIIMNKYLSCNECILGINDLFEKMLLTFRFTDYGNYIDFIKLICKKLLEKNDNNKTTKIKSTFIKPLIKWSGGKYDELTIIFNNLPTYYTRYVEPFVGGGSVYWNINITNSEEEIKYVINDNHDELINFYNQIKEDPASVYEFMKNNINSEETYYLIRDNLIPKNQFEIACKFYYLRKTCFRGMMRYNSKGGFNIPFGKYKTINFEQLKNPEFYQNKLQQTEIFNEDFEDIFIEYANDPNTFIFLDPPYDCEFSTYYKCFSKDDHIRLCNCIKNARCKILMIIGETEFIRNLYCDTGFIRGSFEKKYKFKIHSKRVGDEINKNHLIIKNY